MPSPSLCTVPDIHTDSTSFQAQAKQQRRVCRPSPPRSSCNAASSVCAGSWEAVQQGWDGHVSVWAGAAAVTPREAKPPYPLLQPWNHLTGRLRWWRAGSLCRLAGCRPCMLILRGTLAYAGGTTLVEPAQLEDGIRPHNHKQLLSCQAAPRPAARISALIHAASTSLAPCPAGRRRSWRRLCASAPISRISCGTFGCCCCRKLRRWRQKRGPRCRTWGAWRLVSSVQWCLLSAVRSACTMLELYGTSFCWFQHLGHDSKAAGCGVCMQPPEHAPLPPNQVVCCHLCM